MEIEEEQPTSAGFAAHSLRASEPTHRRIKGRQWRVTDPALPPDIRMLLVKELMAARRAVKTAMKLEDERGERKARDRVHAAKVGLGERGLKWWKMDEAPPADVEQRVELLFSALSRALEDAGTCDLDAAVEVSRATARAIVMGD